MDVLLQEVNMVQALVQISQISHLLNDDQANTTMPATLSPTNSPTASPTTAAGGRRWLNTTAAVSARGRLVKQAAIAQKQVHASRENVALQAPSAKVITFAGDLGADSAQEALDWPTAEPARSV
jgi:hypothetical protein